MASLYSRKPSRPGVFGRFMAPPETSQPASENATPAVEPTLSSATPKSVLLLRNHRRELRRTGTSDRSIQGMGDVRSHTQLRAADWARRSAGNSPPSTVGLRTRTSAAGPSSVSRGRVPRHPPAPAPHPPRPGRAPLGVAPRAHPPHDLLPAVRRARASKRISAPSAAVRAQGKAPRPVRRQFEPAPSARPPCTTAQLTRFTSALRSPCPTLTFTVEKPRRQRALGPFGRQRQEPGWKSKACSTPRCPAPWRKGDVVAAPSAPAPKDPAARAPAHSGSRETQPGRAAPPRAFNLPHRRGQRLPAYASRASARRETTEG